MTNDLFDRVMQHKKGEIEGFTKKYKINRLVYFEKFRYVNNCIAREKQLKGFSRIKKIGLIEAMNPTWEDFAADWVTKIQSLPTELRTYASPSCCQKADYSLCFVLSIHYRNRIVSGYQ